MILVHLGYTGGMIEIEAKFLVGHEETREKLKKLGGVLVKPMREMTRQCLDIPGRAGDGSWLRVRDEGDGEVTMSYKQQGERTISGTSEICLRVDNLENALLFLKECGMVVKSLQQTRRESWELFGASIDLDEWPWIPSFIEIEAEDEETVRRVAEELGLDMANAIYGSVEPIYMKYYDVSEEDIDGWEEILLGPVPEWLEIKRRA